MEIGFTPEWDIPPHAAAFMSVRGGGFSRTPYDSLNLGDHVGDERHAVDRNRALLCKHLGVEAVFLKQVHGETVHRINTTPSRHDTVIEADIVVSTTPGFAATIMVADCLPVLFAHSQVPVVAAAHAGWRGLAGNQATDGLGVVQRTLEAMADQANEPLARFAKGVTAWLGPAIGPNEFEVGEEVREAFLARNQHNAQAFVQQPRAGKYLADLPLIARKNLSLLGVTQISGNDSSRAWCTVSQTERYFSHRRDQNAGGSGRLAALIWLK